MARVAHIVAGLAFGDEGKGTMVDFLCRKHGAKLVVRYNGGPQSGHRVVLPDGRSHTFSQFGSGTFTRAKTYLSRYVLVEPFAMMNEAEVLAKIGVDSPFDLMTVDPECPIITPWHWRLNRLREKLRGIGNHGSCGFGVGEARMDQIVGRGIKVRDIVFGGAELREKLLAIQRRIEAVLYGMTLASESWIINESVDKIVDLYRDWSSRISVGGVDSACGDVVFEGAQGVLLDEFFGFHPHTTWSNTTFGNALNLLQDVSSKPITPIKIGVLRTYFTRHGAGPFISECDRFRFPDSNVTGPWQGAFRQGYFDLVATRYAIDVCGGVDCLALTHLDVDLSTASYSRFPCVVSYRNTESGDVVRRLPLDGWTPASDLRNLCPVVENRDQGAVQTLSGAFGVPVRYRSFGPTWKDKQESI